MTNELVSVTITVNGREREARVEPRTLLADFLRDHLRLTGTHLGCEHGVCGACTVLLDGEPVRSCLTFAAQAAGSRVDTVESLADGDRLHPLQEAFAREHALQCGFCTPGFLMTAAALLEARPDADDEAIDEALEGVLCRCTGYVNIVKGVRAVRDAARS